MSTLSPRVKKLIEEYREKDERNFLAMLDSDDETSDSKVTQSQVVEASQNVVEEPASHQPDNTIERFQELENKNLELQRTIEFLRKELKPFIDAKRNAPYTCLQDNEGACYRVYSMQLVERIGK